MRWKPHVRFGGRAGETHPPKDGQGAPDRSHLANQKLDECRRRVQNETLGHRGRKDDPLYRCRRLLTKADERLDEHGRTKLLGLLVKNIGATTRVMATRQTLLEQLRSAPLRADVLFLDADMPEIDGFRALETIRTAPSLMGSGT